MTEPIHNDSVSSRLIRLLSKKGTFLANDNVPTSSRFFPTKKKKAQWLRTTRRLRVDGLAIWKKAYQLEGTAVRKRQEKRKKKEGRNCILHRRPWVWKQQRPREIRPLMKGTSLFAATRRTWSRLLGQVNW